MAQLLLDNKCDADARDAIGHTPLHFAAQRGELQLFQLLLRNQPWSAAAWQRKASGSSSSSQDGKSATAEGPPQKQGKQAAASFPSSSNSSWNSSIKSLLHCAVQGGNSDILRLLLKGGAATLDDPQGQDSEPHTPNALHLACRLGNKSNVLLLLQHGYSAKAKGLCGMTPLHNAAMGGLEGSCVWGQDLLPGSSKPQNSNSKTAAPGTAAKPGTSVSKPASTVAVAPSASPATATAALQQPPSQSCSGICCQPATKPSQTPAITGQTPAGAASAGPALFFTLRQHTEVFELLLASGGDALVADDFGITTLMYAAGSGNMAVLDRCIGLGASAAAVDKRGWTALHWAAAHGHTGMFRVLGM